MPTQCFVPKEPPALEMRAALTPASAEKLRKLGLHVRAEIGLGRASDYPDSEYEKAGVELISDRAAGLSSADIVLRVRRPEPAEVGGLKSGSLHVSFLDPFNERDLIRAFAERSISAISMEMIPRTTLAQKMDALSSQANLAGYYAVIKAAERSRKILPMAMTPAGTISPSRVFVIGAGVAGLQAIATARRLGARVEAFDTRPVVEEQVRSLGAKFVKIDLGETGQTAQGYAKELTPEQIARQQEGMAKACAASDIIVTTARVFGRRAPILITAAMIERLRPGTLIVDLAVETGGNVEGIRPGEEVVTPNGVVLIGHTNLEGRVSYHASQVYAANLANLIEHFWDEKSQALRLDQEDEILRGCLITHQGKVVHEKFR